MKTVLRACLISWLCHGASAQNQPDRLEWFRDQGFGLFIHWSLDSQLGAVISHSMAGADESYLRRFIFDLPRTFHPRRFEPREWAALARLAGMRYVVFTAKHHSGFCMFDTATTDFCIRNTPFGRDVTREILDAFRAEGIAPGLYFSPDDFWWLWKNGIDIQRNTPEASPLNNPGLMAHNQAQLRELLTRYGPVSVLFLDGPPEGLRELAWQLQPGIVVTRGAIATPEQYVPGVPLDGAWESCITMGTQWQYKPSNETYKSGGELIRLLIETRAKGGNLLLNAGPKPNGELPVEQEERLREIALWMFVNGEAIHGVRPWVITNEGDYWFTRKKDENTVYVFVATPERWPYGAWRDITLRSIRATDKTTAGVLGQNDRVLEYQPDVTPATTWRQDAKGLHIRAMRAQRLYNDRKWPNPVVLKLTHAEPALVPPRIETREAKWDPSSSALVLAGEVLDLGKAETVEAGFEYRDVTGLDLTERPGSYSATEWRRLSQPGRYELRIEKLPPGRSWEVRAVLRHPLLTVYGSELRVRSQP